jgi:FkbM family methyltransferase
MLISRALQAAWIAVRGVGRALLGRDRFDGLVGRLHLRDLKARYWMSDYRADDGSRLLYRSQDFCVIDEVFKNDVYRREMIGDGQIVVDAGAHIGAFTILAARRVGPKGRVLSFEPSPRTYELLVRNVGLNALPQVQVQPLALAEKEGEAPFFFADSAAVNPVTDTLGEGRGRPSVLVRLRRLDDVLAEEGVDRVDHLKIDVEGAEMRVLDGAPKTLAATRHIIMEVHPDAVKPEDVKRRLESLGFACELRPQGAALLLEATR